jgi:hypothetical protein
METRLSKIFRAFQAIFFEKKISVPQEGIKNNDIPFQVNRPWTLWRERFSYGIFFLFVGFLFGNLFGTFLPLIRLFFPWDGFIVLIIIFVVELLSYRRYHKQGGAFLGIWKDKKTKRRKDESIDRWKECNYFKIGFLLGFFIDAYKVGS